MEGRGVCSFLFGLGVVNGGTTWLGFYGSKS